MNFDAEVIIIGSGVAGAASAYHLAEAGCKNVIVLESGKVGIGEDGGYGGESEPRLSGSAVMASPANTIKMVIQLYACSSEEYVQHHGMQGARDYLRLASIGTEHIKKIAPKVLPDVSTKLHCLGSLYVTDEAGAQGLHKEYRLLKELGCEGIELWGQDKVEALHGKQAGFVIGIRFPNDAIIDSSAYSMALIRHATSTGSVRIRERCPRVTRVESADVGGRNAHAVVYLQDGSTLRCRHVVVCTGGLFLEQGLAGVMQPCWSYLTSLAAPKATCEMKHEGDTSMNYFTWGFSHDWCVTKGHVRVSGEDHYSALKPAHSVERNRSLADWCAAKYPSLQRSVDGGYAYQCGVYSATPDHAPLLGKPHKDSRVAYLVGCNAWGQACLSFGASLVPGMLGYRALAEEEEQLLASVSISRFAHLPVVQSASHGDVAGARAKL